MLKIAVLKTACSTGSGGLPGERLRGPQRIGVALAVVRILLVTV